MGKQRKLKVLCASVMALTLVGTQLPRVFANDVKTEHGLIELDRGNKNKNLVKNNQFDSDASNWNMVNAEVTNDANNKVGKIKTTNNSNANAHIWQDVSLKANTVYVLKADIKVLGGKGAYATLDVKKGGSTQGGYFKDTRVEYTDGNWKKVELEFNSEDNTTVAVGIGRWDQSASEVLKNSEILIDNVELVEKNPTASTDDKYEILWADDFNGTELDQTKWGYELGSVRGCEQQHYVADKENVFMRDGNLVLKATDRAKEDQYILNRAGSTRKVIYNSGSVRTHGKQEFLYGRIEMRAKLPKGKGVFPAFWTLGSDFVLDGDIDSKQGYGWARCGEIDIMELIGGEEGSVRNKQVWHTGHTDANNKHETKIAGRSTTINEDFYNDYHVFGINWSPNKLEWYVDDKVVISEDYSNKPVAQKALNRPQYIQMNLAMGGNWPGDVAEGLAGTEFDIDYVYYGQNAEQKAAAQEYYANAPKLGGLHDITMTQGEKADLLKDVTVNDGYFVDFSIDDEYMFKSTGGRTECSIRCRGKDDLDSLAKLPAGKYNIHYTAIPNDVEYEPDQWDSSIQNPVAAKEYKFDRKTVTLTVKEPVKTDKLDTLINDVEKFLENKDQYNADAIKALEEKLAAAKELLKQNPTQEQIDAMVKELQAVYDVAKDSKNGPLIPLEPSKPIIPLTPLEPSKPVVPLTPLEPSKPVVSLTPLEESKPVVQTGDTTMMTVYAMGLIGAVASVMMLRKKREN